MKKVNEISRRDFVKTAGSATVASLILADNALKRPVTIAELVTLPPRGTV